MKREVIRAEVYGFCSGVRRAIDLALEAGEKTSSGEVFTLGQLVHNQRIMEMLEERGVKSSVSLEDVASGTAIIRAHGAPAGTVEKLQKRGIHVVDATCPKVARSHSIIESYTKRGYHVIVAGERNHDEVQGLVSRTTGADVVESTEEAARLVFQEPAILIAQTTFRSTEYEAICKLIQEKCGSVEIFKTVCPAMENRCEALLKLVGKVEAIVVIGGMNSANTRRLHELAVKTGLPAWHIEGAGDLPDEVFVYGRIGITAGASTPDYVVEEVEHRLESGSAAGQQ